MEIYNEILKVSEGQKVSNNEVRMITSLEGVLHVVSKLRGTTFEHELTEFDKFYKTLGRPQSDLVWVEKFAQYEEVK